MIAPPIFLCTRYHDSSKEVAIMLARWKIIVALLAVLLLAACGAAPTSTGATTDGGDVAAPPASAVARIGWGGSPDSLNPGVGVLVEAYTIYGLVYDAMFEL
jgi:ABC-type transport system substrate-binding protein